VLNSRQQAPGRSLAPSASNAVQPQPPPPPLQQPQQRQFQPPPPPLQPQPQPQPQQFQPLQYHAQPAVFSTATPFASAGNNSFPITADRTAAFAFDSANSFEKFGANSAGGDAAPPVALAMPLPPPPPPSAYTQHSGIVGDSIHAPDYYEKTQFPWSALLKRLNLTVFGNQSFRPLQLAVMNAALAGRDCFVLMPTGGGKSLCYQLPAIIDGCSDDPRPERRGLLGLTVVVSPLLSLIEDQCMQLLATGVKAAMLVSTQAYEVGREIIEPLRQAARGGPPPELRMLYVTPEKLARSGQLISVLDGLYGVGLLRRFVIDEAHCVSMWGHDFRQDYTQLSVVKQRYPQVPLMALTATATEAVRVDVQQQLGIATDACVRFQRSFNRSNLIYEVRPKKAASIVADMVAFIRQHYPRDGSGIVYCFSTFDCEKVAEEFSRDHNFRALPYHAKLSPADRENAHRQWSAGRVRVVCATIAFGMGINKPDVRFVLHHTLPKSLEGYYQESGRAGRDGLTSHAVLYFSLGDVFRLRSLFDASIDEQAATLGPAEVARRKRDASDQVSRVVAYAQNLVECRREQQLAYFGEAFDAAQCRRTCDNCAAQRVAVERDVCDVAHHLLAIVRALNAANQNCTVAQITTIARAGSSKKVAEMAQRFAGLAPHANCAKALEASDCERVIMAMLQRGLFDAHAKKDPKFPQRAAINCILPGPRAADFDLPSEASKPFMMKFVASGGGTSSSKAASKRKDRAATTATATAAAASSSTGRASKKLALAAGAPAVSSVGAASSARGGAAVVSAIRPLATSDGGWHSQTFAPDNGDKQLKADLREQLLKDLRDLREALAAQSGVRTYHIYSDIAMENMSRTVPTSISDLSPYCATPNIVHAYGDRILKLLRESESKGLTRLGAIVEIDG
jgi:RecQ family ATP-dependent DNA helicase